MTLNVFFKVSEPLYGETVIVSNEIRRRFETDFWVDDQHYFPHLSLFLFEALAKNKSKIIGTARRFAAQIKPFKVRATGMSVGENGLVMVDFEKSKKIYRHHLKTMKLFNSLREGKQREKYQDQEYLLSLVKEDQEKIVHYGHRWILDKYQPHITIAKIAESNICKEVVREYESQFKGKSAEVIALRISQEVSEPIDQSLLIFDQPLA